MQYNNKKKMKKQQRKVHLFLCFHLPHQPLSDQLRLLLRVVCPPNVCHKAHLSLLDVQSHLDSPKNVDGRW